MENKDYLKEILGKIDEVNEPVDLEEAILKTIEQQESIKLQITRYQARGTTALLVSAVLIVILGVLFSLPSSMGTTTRSITSFAGLSLALLILFIQLEMGGAKIFNQIKNYLS
jgi:protein-S-isoprenylcysteine O-methyltransferase Ste14